MDEKDIDAQVDEILGFMKMIRRKLVGDDFSLLMTKFYNLETYEPEACPECGKKRSNFFLMLQPGDNLFDLTADKRPISNFKVFCLECTKKYNVLDKTKGKEVKADG
ncbi:MAG: hypothetical protein ACFFCS_05760 [Candidatus Hodarchaeota archaeon]